MPLSKSDWNGARPLRCCVSRTSSQNTMTDETCSSAESTSAKEVTTDGVDSLYNKQRTVVLVRQSQDATFGFALQSYVFKRRDGGFTEQLTYVDYVRDGSPAAKAGVRRGDVILSVNGFSAMGQSHSSLVTFINSLLRMKLVVLFQNIARIVQLSARSLQLQYILREKEMMVKMLELEERKILKNGLLDLDKLSLSSLDRSSDHPEDPEPLHLQRLRNPSIRSEYDNSPAEVITRL